MSRPISLTLTALLSTACTHDLTPTTELRTQQGNDEAREHLGAADFTGARAEYERVLGISPLDVEANVGWVIADLLLLPDTPALADFLLRCNQPSLTVARDLFGESGLLAQLEEARAGDSTLRIHRYPMEGSAFTRVDFEPAAIRTQLLEGGGDRTLQVTLDELKDDGVNVTFGINPDDTRAGDAAITPLAAGAIIDVSDLAGWVAVSLPLPDGRRYRHQIIPSGTITFVEYGPNPGDRVVIDFSNVTIGGECVVANCTVAFNIEGRVSDRVGRPIGYPPSRIPFLTVEYDDGPPRREPYVVAFDQCADLDRAYLAGQLREIGNVLARDSQHLERVLERAPADQLRYVVPRELIHMPADIPLNATDLHMLKAAVDIAGAAIEVAVQYKYAEGVIQDMMTDYCRWADEDGDDVPECHDTRDFSPFLLHMNYDANFMTRTASFDLDVAKRRLGTGLEAASAALSERPVHAGIFDFSTPSTASLAGELAAAIEATRRSIDSATPVAIPSAPLYAMHLKTFFGEPLDRTRLLMLTGLSSLVGFEAGNASSNLWYERNDRWWIEAETLFENLEVSTGGAITLPPDNTISCGSPATCGEGYTCGEAGRCEALLPRFLQTEAWDAALFVNEDEWPTVLSRSVEVFFRL